MKAWQVTIGDRAYTADDLDKFGDLVDLSLLTGDGYRIDPFGEPRHLLALLALFASRDGSASPLEWLDTLRLTSTSEVLATLGEAVGDGN